MQDPWDLHPSSSKADQRDLTLGRFWNFSTTAVWGWVSGCRCVLQAAQHTPCLLLARCQEHPRPSWNNLEVSPDIAKSPLGSKITPG